MRFSVIVITLPVVMCALRSDRRALSGTLKFMAGLWRVLLLEMPEMPKSSFVLVGKTKRKLQVTKM